MLTQLEAINILLTDAREARINTIDLADEDTATAVDKLEEAKKEVLSEGLNFNYDFNRELIQDNNGEIILPSFLSIDFEMIKYVARVDNGITKVYNTEDKTFNIGEKVKVNIIRDSDFEDITNYKIQYWITKVASYNFYQVTVGIDNTLQLILNQATIAEQKAKSQDATNQDNNMFDGNRRSFKRTRNN
jgi:hypothetical protein